MSSPTVSEPNNEQYLQSLLTNSADALISTDTQGIIRSWSQGAEQMFGYSAATMIGQHLDRLLPPDLAQAGETKRLADQVHTLGFIKNHETVRLTRDGKPLMVELMSHPIVAEDGGTVGFSIIMHDLTQRKQLEQDLLKTQGYLARKVDGLAIINEIGGILQTTVDLNQILYVILVGATAGQALGFNRAFLLLVDQGGQYLEGKLALGPADAAQAGEIWAALGRRQLSLQQLLQVKQEVIPQQNSRVNAIVRNLQIPLINRDHILIQAIHKKRSFNITDGWHDSRIEPAFLHLIGTDKFVVVPLLGRDKAVGVLLADNAITGHPIQSDAVELLEIFAHQASTAIEQAYLYAELEGKVRELEQAYETVTSYQEKLIHSERLATIGQMAATVAHELRNPLVSIGGFARSLLKHAAIDKTSRLYLEIIVDEVMRLENIVSGVLELSKPPSLKRTLTPLNAVIDEALAMSQDTIKSHHIQVNKNLAANLSPIAIDRDRIKEALLNLINNAIQAMPQGGQLHLWSAEQDDYIKVEVADTGEGIPLEDQGKVFNPFFSTKPAGTGLGLTIVARIIHEHDGHITLESLAGEGTRFLIRLPKALANPSGSGKETDS